MEGKFLAQVKTAPKIMLMIPLWNAIAGCVSRYQMGTERPPGLPLISGLNYLVDSLKIRHKYFQYKKRKLLW